MQVLSTLDEPEGKEEFSQNTVFQRKESSKWVLHPYSRNAQNRRRWEKKIQQEQTKPAQSMHQAATQGIFITQGKD